MITGCNFLDTNRTFSDFVKGRAFDALRFAHPFNLIFLYVFLLYLLLESCKITPFNSFLLCLATISIHHFFK